MKKILSVAFAFMVFCSHQRYQIKYVDTAFDTSNISRIAVFDFENKSDITIAGSYAAERLKRYINEESELTVVDGERVEQAVEELHLTGQSWMSDPQKIKEIGEYLAVDALIMGAVTGIDDTHSRMYYTERFDTGFEISIEIRAIENTKILYSNNCGGSDQDITIHHKNPEFLEKRIARELIDRCIKQLSSEFLPKKVKMRIEK